jgi:hypothetical protein
MKAGYSITRRQSNMKAELLVNLKTANGAIVKAGTIFTDPIPEFIMKRVSKGTARIISTNKVEESVVKEIPIQVIKKPEASIKAMGGVIGNRENVVGVVTPVVEDVPKNIFDANLHMEKHETKAEEIKTKIVENVKNKFLKKKNKNNEDTKGKDSDGEKNPSK